MESFAQATDETGIGTGGAEHPYSFRRMGHTVLTGRKLIKCPHCSELLMDIDRELAVRIYRIGNGKRDQCAQVPGMTFIVCKACRSEVGYTTM